MHQTSLEVEVLGLARMIVRPAVLVAQRSGIVDLASSLLERAGPRYRRRVWSAQGRAYVEVRGHTRDGLAEAVIAAVRELDGVDWAEFNAITGQVLAAFDEQGLSVDQVVEVVKAIEQAHGTAEDPFQDLPAHPVESAPFAAELLSLATDGAAFGLATAGRFVRWPALPRSTRIAVALVDGQPWLRRQLAHHLGERGTNLALAVSNAVVHGLTQQPSALAVDFAYRLTLLMELTARRRVWQRRERALSFHGLPDVAAARLARPILLPGGPVEAYANQAAFVSLPGAAVTLSALHDLGAASDVVLASVPRAAWFGREGFAAMLDSRLSRHGVIALDGAAYRKLDRVDTVVVDSAVLCRPGARILSAKGGRAATDQEVWRIAARLLAADPDVTGIADSEGRTLTKVSGSPADLDGMRLNVMSGDHRKLGSVRVGCLLDPLTDPVLAAARCGEVRVLLTAHASSGELVSVVDGILPASDSLPAHVRRLQRDGHVVLAVTGDDASAVSAADVGIAVLGHRHAHWAADLVCGPGLEEVWRLLDALSPARAASRRGVRLAAGGSALSALLTVTQRRPRLNLGPVHSAALLALTQGAVTARRLAARPAPRPVPRIDWHALDPGDAVSLAEAIPVSAESTRDRRGILPALRHELSDPLTPVLVLGAAASAIVGSGVDAGLVGGVMLGNALIGSVQQVRAERALRRLLLDQRPSARRVTGRNRYQRVPGAELRPGNLIMLRSSDVVPADARLLEATSLEVDESSLTGESLPVAKSTGAVPGADLSDRTCMLFQDTTVLAGRAVAVVVATGSDTQAGRAAGLAKRSGRPPGGLQAQLNELTRTALPLTGVSGVLVSALSLVRGVRIRDAVSSGVAVAVAAVPEGLPLVALVSQLAAARRLSRRKVLVRNSRTLGTLGRVDTLCFDKTGTLTEGKLHVTKLSAPYGRTDPGEVLLRTAARAGPQTRAGLTHATDRAVAGAADALLGPDSGWRLRKEMQFEASRGYSAAIGEVDGQLELAVKGAPEIVLSRCGHVLNGTSGVRPMTAQNHRAARATVRRLTGMGLRVLAVALAKPAPDQLPDLADQDVDLMLVGFVSMADTPRPEAPGAIKHLTEAGVSVAMITGDHPGTASAIAADLGIPDADRVLTGHDLDRLSDRDRAEQIAHTTVFARVGPEHKVQIVEGLQRAGHTVSMTGDGANDAAAIRLADVGIGVTSGDSHAAPAAADLVLPGADLPAILEALAEGRSLWESVSNAVSILVGGNAGEVAFTIYGTAVGGRAPLATRQLLLVNTLTDMMPALAVALAPPQHEGMPARTTLSSAIALRGVVTAFGAILAWQIGRLTGLRARRASTMGLAALVLTQLAQTLQMGERTWSILLTAILSAVILAAIIETPGISRFFGCTPLGPAAWGIVIASVTSAIVLSTFARTHPKITNLINRIATPAALPTTTG